jgi:hypothetical protein
MAKAQRVRFLFDYFDHGELRFARGQDYPLDPESVMQVMGHGAAELIEVDVDADQHQQELAAAHARWNLRNRASIAADPALRHEVNPAAALVNARLAELAARVGT